MLEKILHGHAGQTQKRYVRVDFCGMLFTEGVVSVSAFPTSLGQRGVYTGASV